MRIAVAGFLHESNTFATTSCRRDDFLAADYQAGQEMVEHWKDAHHEIGGMIAGIGEVGLDLVPMLAASATPSGPVERDTYEGILAEMIDEVKAAGPIDGLLLALHGSMFTPGLESADGETARRLREAIGQDIPMVLTLDMHANISDPMITAPDATVAYRTYPHVDQRDRGREAARHMAWISRNRKRPAQVMIKLPLLIHIVRQFTGEGAMKQLMDAVEEVSRRPGILSASLAPGYIYADVPDMGVSVIVVSETSVEEAEGAAWEIADLAWALKDDLNAGLPDPKTAIAEAARVHGLVSLMDCGDNIGGGGPGDSTVLFADALHQGLAPVAVILLDAEAVEACHHAGTGAHVSLSVGGRSGPEHGRPIPISGTVLRVGDGRYTENEPRHGGHRYFNQGTCALIQTVEGNLVLVNSLRVMPSSLEQWLSMGVDLAEMKAVIVKGATAPLAAYAPISSRVIAVDSPGVTKAGPEAFAYQKRPYPLFPLDADISSLREHCRVTRSPAREFRATSSHEGGPL